MKDSYKKRLLNRMLITSSVLLSAAFVQTHVAADSQETPGKQTDQVTVQQVVTPDTTTQEANVSHETSATSELNPPLTSSEQAVSDSNEETLASTETLPNEHPSIATRSAVETPLARHVIEAKEATIYMSEEAQLKETLSVKDVPTDPLTWTLDGKAISDWKTWDLKKGDFVGQPFINVEGQREGEDYHLTVHLEALFGEDLQPRSPSNIRRTYRHFIGEHQLVGKTEDGSFAISKSLNFRPYASFRTHDEMLAEIEETKDQALKDRLVMIENIGKSAENRDVKMAIIAKDQASIDDYLKHTTPQMLMQPDQMLKRLKEGTFDYKLPILINNTHADEQPGIDIITSLFKEFASKEVISFATTTADGKQEMVKLDVASLLEKFIFLFDFTENPDGDVANTRSLINGMDPNRDASFQTNPETRNIVTQINKWNPIALFDIHGFVKSFLIEPATPPHDPNFEYDLLSDLMLEHAQAMGRAGVQNSKYESFAIPKLHWGEGWDDAFSGYTGVYAMYHGILGHTLEIPEANEESFKAGLHAVLGGIAFLANQPDKLMETRLKFYSRGINKVEDPKAEEELVGPDGKVVGRLKGEQPKFFPDYYVIPMSLDKMNDLGEAYNMIAYFERNGVQVKQLTEDVDRFKAGDLVVDMAQAKRGFANHVLYSGSNESKWGAMYAELVVNFPDMRGFKSTAVFKDHLFDGKLDEVKLTQAPRTSMIDEKAPYYVIANTSKQAVQAVNKAIQSGEHVFLTEDGYIVTNQTFSHLVKEYALYGDPLYKKPSGKSLKASKVYSPDHIYGWAGDFHIHTNSALALKELGFDMASSADEADVIVLESKQFDASIFGKKPIILVGGEAMQQLEKLGILQGFDAEQAKDGDAYEGLMRAIVDESSPLASGYAMNDLFYSNSGNYIKGTPDGFKSIVKIADKDYYITGWWPGNEILADKTVAIAGVYQGQPIFIYAGNPTNKLHTIHFYRWVSNAIFGDQLATLSDLPQTSDNNQMEMPSPMPNGQVRPQARPQVTTPKPQQAPHTPTEPKPTTPSVSEPMTAPVHMMSMTPHVSASSAQQLSTQPKEEKVLPQTGDTANLTMTISGILLATAGTLLYLKRKEG